ncbi:MAG: thioesterase family protein [Rhodospirillales bacterium]|nr:thioesterase family protein [Rhodospirillales bacterium]
MSNGLMLHAEPVQDIWLDAYGHLNEAYYLVPFSNATWALQEHFDIGVPYFERTGAAIYTVESHVRYLKEVRAPAMMEIQSLILGVDAKRLHIAHVMSVEGVQRATFECMGLHYDTRAGKTAEFSQDVQAALQQACVLPLPDWAGRSVSLLAQNTTP